jgi:DnaJ-class molecular chaperone
VVADNVKDYGSGFSHCTSVGTNAPCNSAANVGVSFPAASTTLVESPVSAACSACHDTAAAKSHIQGKGGLVYAERGTGFVATQESCLGCHGRGKAWAINKAHGVP